MDPDDIAKLMDAAFDNATIKVVGDGAHFEALVIAAEFEGLRTLARHQLVYKSLGELVGNEIHALSIKAMTPGEWQEQAGNPLG